MPHVGYFKSRSAEKFTFPVEEVAENFRQALMRLHRLWDPAYEIIFWRKGRRVLCEIQHSCSHLDKRRVLRMRRRALKMRHDPLKTMKVARFALNLTVAEAARRSGLSRSHWNMIELGRKRMKLETLYRIAEALELPPEKLLYPSTQCVARRRHSPGTVSKDNVQELAEMQKVLEKALTSKGRELEI